MKATGCLLVILAAIGIGIGVYINSSVANKLNALKGDVARNCENAKPILQRRYRSVESLIQAYERHFGWDNGVFVGNPRQFNQSWELVQPGGATAVELTPELRDSQEVKDGLAAFNGGGAVLEQIRGADQVERNLVSFVAAAIRRHAINDDALLAQLKADIVATDKDAADTAEAINLSATRYNEALAGSYLGKRQGFQLVAVELRPVSGALF